MQLPVLDPGMTHDDDISPSDMNIAGQDDDAIGNGIDRKAKAFGAPPVSHPVLSKMTACTEAPGFVKTDSIGRGHGEVKPVCTPSGSLRYGRAEDCRKEENQGESGDERYRNGRHGF